MEDAILTILFFVGIPICVIVLFIKTSRLKARVAALEAALSAQRAPESAAAAPPDIDKTIAAVAPGATAPLATEAPPATPWDRATGRATTDTDLAAIAPPDPPPAPAKPAGPGRLTVFSRWLRDNWVYVVSAASLALAGVFFVQYGVERGLLPPGARVLAALAFGAVLVLAGEWLRRRHGDEGATPTVNLPSVFSGAGVVTLFAATLAARQLYGLIGPETAFAGHLATAALAIALGWFSGPLLVAVGLIGACLAPFIVGGGAAAGDWLYAYLVLIAGVGLAVDAVRRWRWVSVLALGLTYGAAYLVHLGGASLPGWTGFLVVAVLAATILPNLRLIPTHGGPPLLAALALRDPGQKPRFSVALVAGAMLTSAATLALLAQGAPDTAMLAFAALAALALAFLLWAEKADGLADMALLPKVGFLAALVAQGATHGPLYQDFASRALALRPPEMAAPMTASLLLAMAALITAAAAYRALRPGPWGVAHALGAALTAPMAAAVMELFWHPAAALGAFVWALHLIGLAALMTGFALQLARQDGPNLRRAAYATLSALSLIALALFVLTTKTALTLALAVLIGVSAALDRRFRLPEMSLFLQAGAAVLGYRLLADPGLGWALYAPLLQVLLAFGGAIAAMLAALWLLAPLSRPTAKAVAESAAAGLAAILANVLITRWLETGQTYQMETHWGLTLNAMPWLVLMLMQLYRARIGGPLTRLRLALAALGGVLAAGGIGLAASLGNPLYSYGPDQTGALVRGPLVLDSLLLAYGIPGLLIGLAAWKLPGLPRRLSVAFAAIGAGLLALYAGLEIRRFWQGEWLGRPGVTQPELYTYTLALMLLGAGLLYQAIAKRSDTLRFIALAVIGLTVIKVYLLDAAGLTGLTRVVSFAGLGLSLAGLAWLNRWAGQAADKSADKTPDKP